MLELKFHPDVSLEVKSSYLWYQSQAEGLGEDFIFVVAVMHHKRKSSYWINRA